jgi:predicted RNA-binding protein with PUA-like domain
MASWLFKEEPSHYSYDDLARDKSTLWNGVNNNLARQHLRKVRRGDRIFYYHTGNEKAVIGEMKAVNDAGPDPNQTDPKAVAVEVRAVRRLPAPVPLSTLKSDPLLKDWDLVRLPRLSILPVSDEQWHRVEEISESGR